MSDPKLDQERAHFERFMADKIGSPAELKRDPDGHYIWIHTSDMWQGWQARAELVGFADSPATVLVEALEEIEEWTLRFTTWGHPVAVTARKALDTYHERSDP